MKKTLKLSLIVLDILENVRMKSRLFNFDHHGKCKTWGRKISTDPVSWDIF